MDLRALEGKGTLRVLAALASSESLQMKDFVIASGTSFTRALELRDSLQRLGIIVVTAGAVRGARTEQIITLTPLGRELAALAGAMGRLLDDIPDERGDRDEPPDHEGEERARRAIQHIGKAARAEDERRGAGGRG